jgi:hypothetical protein
MMNEIGTPMIFEDLKTGKVFECNGTIYQKMSSRTAMITCTTIAKGFGKTCYFKMKTPVRSMTMREYMNFKN